MNLGHKSLPKVNHALVHSNTTFYQSINVHPSKASTTTTTTTSTTDQRQVTIFTNATKLGTQPKKGLKHNHSENNISINQNKSKQNNPRQNEITTKITNTSESPRSASISPRPSHKPHPNDANNPLEKHRQRLLSQTTPSATTPLVINYGIQPMTQQQKQEEATLENTGISRKTVLKLSKKSLNAHNNSMLQQQQQLQQQKQQQSTEATVSRASGIPVVKKRTVESTPNATSDSKHDK